MTRAMSKPRLSAIRRTLAVVAFPLLLSLVGMLFLRHFTTARGAGSNATSFDIEAPTPAPLVNIFLGALFLLTILIPIVVQAERRTTDQLVAALAAIAPVCLMTATRIDPDQLHFTEWAKVITVI